MAVDRGVGAEVPRPLVGVEEIVAEELEKVAVILIRAGLETDTDYAAEELPEFGARIVGEDVEFLNGVDVRRVGDIIVNKLVVIHTVQKVVIRLFAIAVDIRTARVKGS